MDYYQDIWHMWRLFIYPLYPETSIPRCMISSDTPLYSHIVGCISMIFPYIPILLMDVDGLYPMIIFHHDYPWSDPPGPACLKLGKVIEAPFSRTRSDRTWKSLGSSPGKNVKKTPKNPLNPPLFPLKIGQKRGGRWNLHFKTDPVGLTQFCEIASYSL